MNWHICKLILAFLHWPWLPAFWADAFYASGKQSRSAPHGLCTTALWGKRRERGFLKLLLRQGGILGWGEGEETVLLSQCFRDLLCYSFVLIYTRWSLLRTQDPAAPLLSTSSDQEEFTLPPSHRVSLPHLLGEEKLSAAGEWQRWWI